MVVVPIIKRFIVYSTFSWICIVCRSIYSLVLHSPKQSSLGLVFISFLLSLRKLFEYFMFYSCIYIGEIFYILTALSLLQFNSFRKFIWCNEVLEEVQKAVNISSVIYAPRSFSIADKKSNILFAVEHFKHL